MRPRDANQRLCGNNDSVPGHDVHGCYDFGRIFMLIAECF